MNNRSKYLMVLIITMTIFACSDGGGQSGTGVKDPTLERRTVVGRITLVDADTIEVKGIQFKLADATILVDDDATANAAQLKLGMIVTITADINQQTASGTATRVAYADNVEGVVDATELDAVTGQGTLVVMGQTVRVTDQTVFESEADDTIDITGIAEGNIVEISGYSDGEGSITATRIELVTADLSDGQEIEVKGIITGLDLDAITFNIGDLVVVFSDETTLEGVADDTLSDGLYVEVKSVSGFNASGQLIANKIEIEGDGTIGVHQDLPENEEQGDASRIKIEIEGPVSIVLDESRFRINGQVIIINSETEFKEGIIDNIKADVLLEVEGYLQADGTLLASKVEVKDEEDQQESEDDD